MKGKIILLLLLFYFETSCGDGLKENSFIYLKLKNTELLYVFNKSEKEVCLEEDISLCESKYSLTDIRVSGKCDIHGCSGSGAARYQYITDDKILIGINYEDYIRSMIASDIEGKSIIYKTNIVSTSKYRTDEYISSAQYVGYCDANFLISVVSDFLGYGKIHLDTNSFTMNPEICKIGTVLQCLSSMGFNYVLDLDAKNKSEIQDMFGFCLFIAYSLDELRLNPNLISSKH